MWWINFNTHLNNKIRARLAALFGCTWEQWCYELNAIIMKVYHVHHFKIFRDHPNKTIHPEGDLPHLKSIPLIAVETSHPKAHISTSWW